MSAIFMPYPAGISTDLAIVSRRNSAKVANLHDCGISVILIVTKLASVDFMPQERVGNSRLRSRIPVYA